MRSIRSRSSVLALTLLALTPTLLVAQETGAPRAAVGHVAHLPPAQDWGGVYRLVLTRGQETLPLRLVVERAGTTIEATMSTAEATGALRNVRVEGGVLRAEVVMARGSGQLELRDTGAGLEGTLVAGRRTWAISGERSS